MEKLPDIQNGKFCEVTKGAHQGKMGTISDINRSKSGNITVTQTNGLRFKTLGRNVQVIEK